MSLPIRFFLASKTVEGFVSYFEQLTDPRTGIRTLILKGGPGSGKSTLMKRAAAALEAGGHAIERIHCASDADSLDGFLDRTQNAAMADGTAPHVIDPRFPGARDALINVGEAWDARALRAKESEIVGLCQEIDERHRRASAYCQAAGALLHHNRLAALPYVDAGAIRTFLRRTELFAHTASAGREETRLLSAVSVGETVFFADTLEALCPNRRYVIEDDWGAASGSLMNAVYAAAADAGLGRILCPCSLRPDKLDHVLLPDADACFTTANQFHNAAGARAIPIEDIQKPIPEAQRAAMRVLLEDAVKLIRRAEAQVAAAKRLHDELERYYAAAMDFSRMDAYYAQTMAWFGASP